MNFPYRSSVAALALTATAALAAETDLDTSKAASLPPKKAKVVDNPKMKARPIPSEHSDVIHTHPEHGEPVQVRWAPTKAAPVFAQFAGGVDVEVCVEATQRDEVDWAEVDFMGVRGWVPKDRLSTESKEDTQDRRWDIRFFSPSGKVEVEFKNYSTGSVWVTKDGTRRKAYELDLGPENNWSVSGMVLFSKDEKCLALSYGGSSWGTDVFVYGRSGDAPFKWLKLDLQRRCWALALRKGLVPAKALPAHLYAWSEEPREQGFVICLAGNFTGPETGQTNFETIRFLWSRRGDWLEVAP